MCEMKFLEFLPLFISYSTEDSFCKHYLPTWSFALLWYNEVISLSKISFESVIRIIQSLVVLYQVIDNYTNTRE